MLENVTNMTIEELENDLWQSPETFPSKLIEEVYSIRKKRISELKTHEIRLLITQNIALKYLTPQAIDILKCNILEEAFYYPGDLLVAVLNIDSSFWQNNLKVKQDFSELLLNRFDFLLRTLDPKDEVDYQILAQLKKFINSDNKSETEF